MRFLDSVIFSDESTFHVSGNCRIWGNENPSISLEHVLDSQNVNEFCALSEESVYDPFFFMEITIIDFMYLDMLKQSFISQLDVDDREKCVHF
jgi:hypothetical protein